MQTTRRHGHFGFILALLFVVFGGALSGIVEAAESEKERIRSIGDLNGKRLGVITGTILDNAANRTLDYTQIHYYEDTEEVLEALYAGEIDAMIDDQPIIRHFAATNPRVRALPGVLVGDSYGYGMRFENDELYEQVNAALTAMVYDGTIKELEKRWIDGEDGPLPEIPDPSDEADGPYLRFGVSPVSPPFVYLDEKGEVTGMDIEIMTRVARRIDRRLVVERMDFSKLVESLLEGRVDAIGACLSITPERRKVMRFTDSYYHGGVAALVLADVYD